jgi:hypothetical protein
MDSFGDCLPSGLEHHVVAHVGKELCLSSVGACGRTVLVFGDGAVVFTAEDQERCRHPFRVRKHEQSAGAAALGLQARCTSLNNGFGRVGGEKVFARQAWGVHQVGWAADCVGADGDRRVMTHDAKCHGRSLCGSRGH